jgi:hypothetical protein
MLIADDYLTMTGNNNVTLCHPVICMMINAKGGVIHVACGMHHVLGMTDRHDELQGDPAASAAQQQHLCDDSNWWAVIPAHD